LSPLSCALCLSTTLEDTKLFDWNDNLTSCTQLLEYIYFLMLAIFPIHHLHHLNYTVSRTMNHPSPYILYDVDLKDEKQEGRNSRTGGGYHDWEAGAPHDPNHRAPPQPIPATPFRRRRVNVSLWYIIALYCSVTFLSSIIIALVVVIFTRLHSSAHDSTLGTVLIFNASSNPTITVYSSVNRSMHATTGLTTTTINITSTVSASTMTMSKLSYRPTVTKVVFHTPPPVTSTKWVDATIK
jgi:hypothetical protein